MPETHKSVLMEARAMEAPCPAEVESPARSNIQQKGNDDGGHAAALRVTTCQKTHDVFNHVSAPRRKR